MEENQTRAFLHAAHEGVLAVDAQGRVTLFNPAAERLMGIAAGSVLGQHVMEVIPNTRLHIVLKTGEAELDQIQDTGTTTVLTNRVPVRNARGEVVGAMATFRDIGEIKRLGREVAALKETRTLLEAIVNSTQDAISVVDEKGLGILINPAYTRLTGLSESEVLQRPATVDIAEGESMHLQVLRTRQAVKHVPMKVGPGRREVLVDCAPIIVDGVLKGSVGVIHDVSELRSLSEQLDKAHQLIRHLDTKYTFDDIVAVSAVMREVVEQARRAAATKATVLLSGESGTGKGTLRACRTSLERPRQWAFYLCELWSDSRYPPGKPTLRLRGRGVHRGQAQGTERILSRGPGRDDFPGRNSREQHGGANQTAAGAPGKGNRPGGGFAACSG